MSVIVRNPANGRFARVTPAHVGLVKARNQAARVPAQDRRAKGYHGPLTRSQVAQLALNENS